MHVKKINLELDLGDLEPTHTRWDERALIHHVRMTSMQTKQTSKQGQPFLPSSGRERQRWTVGSRPLVLACTWSVGRWVLNPKKRNIRLHAKNAEQERAAKGEIKKTIV